MQTTDPRTKNYRASRLRMWEDLMRQHHAYVEHFQENEACTMIPRRSTSTASTDL